MPKAALGLVLVVGGLLTAACGGTSRPRRRARRRPRRLPRSWSSPRRSRRRVAHVVVRGTASVFEATLVVELRRDGDVLERQTVTASEGAPARGSFTATLHSRSGGAATVVAFAPTRPTARRSTFRPFRSSCASGSEASASGRAAGSGRDRQSAAAGVRSGGAGGGVPPGSTLRGCERSSGGRSVTWTMPGFATASVGSLGAGGGGLGDGVGAGEGDGVEPARAAAAGRDRESALETASALAWVSALASASVLVSVWVSAWVLALVSVSGRGSARLALGVPFDLPFDFDFDPAFALELDFFDPVSPCGIERVGVAPGSTTCCATGAAPVDVPLTPAGDGE